LKSLVLRVYIRTLPRQPDPQGGFLITTPQLLIFTIEDQRYALRLAAVDRVVRAAAVTPLPKAPEVVLGVLDLQGQVIPVINLRLRFSLPQREILSTDQYLIARANTRTVALAVDSVVSVMEECEPIVAPDDILNGTDFLEGVTRSADGLVLIHDLARLLFPEEELLLEQALRGDQ
jgi:purine-binding chemotaxis protein CheW